MDKMVEKLLKNDRDLTTDENRILTNYIHQIDVKSIEHFKSKPHPIPYQNKNQQRQNMMNNNILKGNNSEYINLIAVLRNRSAKQRLCLDGRNIHKYSTPQYDASINIEAIFGRITDSYNFPKIALKYSFWLISFQTYRDNTSFSIDVVIYRFKVVPLGLQCSSSAPLRALHSILSQYEDSFVHNIDDILKYSNNSQDYIKKSK